ncbi:hypothetical protein BU23DRAFT_547351 [Bimuria novae-zelandiae CBS 107.79]|uniref:Concanavalin A-like lectin/glucanase n=1 Tax=Bimuria novae-zelandiae CBS 107.79 TaxID=1447943 RepID=A0A6A5UII1_9PLEO|nr:hypothetical protein BU23DRAFT_547351 [Bimuria novae-zelandiae CBS 107.79]
MKLSLPFLTLLPSTLGALLVDFSASRGDDPGVIGFRNLEAARGDKPHDNTADLYIKAAQDASGTAAAHFHRAKGNIRAEYHALKEKTLPDTTYWIGYDVAVATPQKGLIIFQFKEYKANNAADGGAGIPLALVFADASRLQLRYQASNSIKGVAVWQKTITPNQRYKFGLAINTGTPGWVELYVDGKQQRLDGGDGEKVKRLNATTFPGRADPKFGAYGGAEVGIDTWVYDVQIGEGKGDVKRAAGF